MQVTMDASRVSAAYSSAFRKLRELPGFDQKVVLRAEMGSILKAWAGRVPTSTQAAADLRSRRALLKKYYLTTASASGNYTSINLGLRGAQGSAGQIWFRTRKNKFQSVGGVSDGGTVKWNNIHYRDADWQGIKESVENYASNLKAWVQRGRNSIGLSRQSVIQCADRLGINLETVAGGGISSAGIAKARGAIASSGRSYQNGSGSEGGDGVKSYIEAVNRLPYGAKIGMDRSLLSVLSGRAKFIETAYKKGAFDSIRSAAAAFPNIFNTSGLS